ncbi:NAD-specific glutamate dehydrogenase [Chromobacterium violaceum]|uniref:NAD-specific glutamate dehydrogenase n=1 Tax=Chromobacterium violaceum TaxID=536 RepID=A0A447TGQ2_CHRVL|nr:NAD-specific glutamate dehydrogenase [Chromobacterium violaceum]
MAELEQRIAHANLPQPLQQVLARLEYAVPLMDIIEIGEGSKLKLEQVAANYFQLGRSLQLDWLRDAITGLPRDNRWQSLARSALRDDLYRVHCKLAKLALQDGEGQPSLCSGWRSATPRWRCAARCSPSCSPSARWIWRCCPPACAS